jgi:S1-C subfamily serine protease
MTSRSKDLDEENMVMPSNTGPIFLLFLLCTLLTESVGKVHAADNTPSTTHAAFGTYNTIRTNNADRVLYIQSVKKNKDGSGVVEKRFGTGFLLTAEGHVLTASHVVLHADANTIVGRFGSATGHPFPLQYIKRDLDIGVDAALLQLPNTMKKLAGVRLGNSKVVPEDADLYVLGFPTPLLNLNSGTGLLSSKFGPNGWWVTSIPLNRGNSGGPIFDIGGNVIAMAVAGADEAQGITYAMPISYAKGLIDMVAIDVNTLRLRTTKNKGEASKSFALYQAVDHSGEKTTNEKFCLPKDYKVTDFTKNVATQNGSEATVSVEPAIGSPNCVVITSQIKGLGVETIGPITTEYKGRGWIGGELKVRGEKSSSLR